MNKKSVIVWEDGTITYKDELGNIRTSSVDDVKMEISNILNRSESYKKLDKLLVGNGLMEDGEYSDLCNNIEEFILDQIKAVNHYEEIRKENYSKLDNILPHDNSSSYYFATRLSNNANKFNQDHQLARHYPLLHKTEYFNSKVRLPNTELLHNKIINLPLWTHL